MDHSSANPPQNDSQHRLHQNDPHQHSSHQDNSHQDNTHQEKTAHDGPHNSTPHDSYFKSVMSQPQAAKDFLQLYLPEDLRARCDLNTLTLQPTEFINDPTLHTCFTDILWSVRTLDNKQRYLYALIEHQSTPDRLMAVRLINYALKTVFRHLKKHHKHQRVPLVVPVLFYAGQRSPYPYSMDWFDCFDEPELARQLYSTPFPLVDITVIPDDNIGRHRYLAVMEFLLKNIALRTSLDCIAGTLGDLLAHQLQAGYTNSEDLRNAVSYAIRTGNSDNHNDFISTLTQRLPQQEDNIMTIAQQLRDEGIGIGVIRGREEGIGIGVIRGREEGIGIGREEGREEGIELGVMKGKTEGKVEMIINMLESGYSPELIRRITKVSESDINKALAKRQQDKNKSVH